MTTLNVANVGEILLTDPRCRQLLPSLRGCFDAWARGRALGVMERVVHAEHEILAKISDEDLLALAPLLGEVRVERPDIRLFQESEFDAADGQRAVAALPSRGWNWFLSREGERCYLGGWR